MGSNAPRTPRPATGMRSSESTADNTLATGATGLHHGSPRARTSSTASTIKPNRPDVVVELAHAGVAARQGGGYIDTELNNGGATFV